MRFIKASRADGHVFARESFRALLLADNGI
jgi:hypothetical protein